MKRKSNLIQAPDDDDFERPLKLSESRRAAAPSSAFSSARSLLEVAPAPPPLPLFVPASSIPLDTGSDKPKARAKAKSSSKGSSFSSSSSSSSSAAATKAKTKASAKAAPKSRAKKAALDPRQTTLFGLPAPSSSSSSSSSSTSKAKGKTKATAKTADSEHKNDAEAVDEDEVVYKPRPFRPLPTFTRDQVYSALEETFGHSEFRENQQNVVEHVLLGHDVFVLAPTGGGKSLCFQLPAVLLSGVTIVVSPLIALMKNQVDYLTKELKVNAARLGSTVEAKEKARVYDDLRSASPSLKLLYVSPELLGTSEFTSVLWRLYRNYQLALFAIDECHCISSWGHDFRPSFLKLGGIKQKFPDVPMIALTATATEQVRKDIIATLGLKDPYIITQSFDRPNIYYMVRHKELFSPSQLTQDLLNFVGAHPGQCGIIYAATRETTQHVADRLKHAGVSVGSYHAGLSTGDRTRLQNEWMEGEVQVIVSTVAFGMGIDKGDVRFVVHYNVPKSLEAYYQESGRAGRDGKPSTALLYFSQDDRRRQEFFNNQPDKFEKSTQAAEERSAAKRMHRNKVFERMVEFCRDVKCRRQMVLAYFGQKLDLRKKPKRCCDVCSDPDKARELAKKALGMDVPLNPRMSTVQSSQVFSKAPKELSYDSYGEENEHDDDQEDEEEMKKAKRESLRQYAAERKIERIVPSALFNQAQKSDTARNRLFDLLERAEASDSSATRKKPVARASKPAQADKNYSGRLMGVSGPHQIADVDVAKREFCLNKINDAVHNNAKFGLAHDRNPAECAVALEASLYLNNKAKGEYLNGVRDMLKDISHASANCDLYPIPPKAAALLPPRPPLAKPPRVILPNMTRSATATAAASSASSSVTASSSFAAATSSSSSIPASSASSLPSPSSTISSSDSSSSSSSSSASSSTSSQPSVQPETIDLTE